MEHWVKEIVDCDVLVVGGGGAAAFAAISSRENKARVVMTDKGQLGKSGCTPNAHGGMAVGHLHPEDSWRIHFEDTMYSGGFLNDQRLVEILCKESLRFIPRLETFGAIFDRDLTRRPLLFTSTKQEIAKSMMFFMSILFLFFEPVYKNFLIYSACLCHLALEVNKPALSQAPEAGENRTHRYIKLDSNLASIEPPVF